MGFYEHCETFHGLPVAEFRPDDSPISDPEGHAYRLRLDYDDEISFDDLFAGFLEDPNAERVTALLLGAWSEEMYDASTAVLVESLLAAAERLPKLKALFLVDVVLEENEVSWIVQSNLSPIWSAFPRLEEFVVRGSQGLSLGTIAHHNLRKLVVQCGGLPREVLQQVTAAELPELEHLELYLGTEYYGWNGTVGDVESLLEAATKNFPKLKYLGLRDSDIADAVAETVAKSPILERLDELDLSLGTLGDAGGQALLASDGVKSLERLNLEHHYMSSDVASQLEALPPEVNVDDEQGNAGPDDRYVSVGE